MHRAQTAPLYVASAVTWSLALACLAASAGAVVAGAAAAGAAETAPEPHTWRIDVRILEEQPGGAQLLAAPTVIALAGRRAEIAIGSEEAAGPPDGPPWFVGTRCQLRVVESPAGGSGPPRLEAEIRTSRLQQSPAGPRLDQQAICLYAPLVAGETIEAPLAPPVGSNAERRVEIRVERLPTTASR